MRVLTTYTSYPCSKEDWRVRFMHDMVHALARLDTVDLRAWGPPGPLPENVRYTVSQADARWLADMLERGGVAHLLRNKSVRSLVSAARLALLLRLAYRSNADVDLYHINWLQGAILLPANGRPCLITVLGTDLKLLDLPGMKTRLRGIFRRHPCILAPNAGWMEAPLTEAFHNEARMIKTVPFGIADRWYALKRRIDYDAPRRWVSVIRVTRKKIGGLFEWGERIFQDRDTFHLYGPNQDNVPIPPWVNYHGPASPEHLLNEVYPTAHGYISLSRHDEGRPQAILEAMAAGLPVIASDIDAHRSLLGRTGGARLVNNGEDLKQAVTSLSTPGIHAEACRAARDFIRQEQGTWDDCARRYLNLYNELLDET